MLLVPLLEEKLKNQMADSASYGSMILSLRNLKVIRTPITPRASL
jgi:hypothetical protein